MMNKTRNQMIGEDIANFKRNAKLKVLSHKDQPYAINSYMVGNSFGQVIGGNRMEYLFNNEQNRNCYPTVFKSKRSAKTHIQLNVNANARIEKFIAEGIKEIQEQYQ